MKLDKYIFYILLVATQVILYVLAFPPTSY